MISTHGSSTASKEPARRVLVVDDDPDVVEVAEVYLERRCDGVAVVTATDPEAAVTRVSEEHFDCVVSDYEMPELDGLELLTAVRDHAPAVPFVLFTNTDEQAVAERARSRGASYLEKGTSASGYDRLAATVRDELDED
jgi:CheY-like chemotaxis protein